MKLTANTVRVVTSVMLLACLGLPMSTCASAGYVRESGDLEWLAYVRDSDDIDFVDDCDPIPEGYEVVGKPVTALNLVQFDEPWSMLLVVALTWPALVTAWLLFGTSLRFKVFFHVVEPFLLMGSAWVVFSYATFGDPDLAAAACGAFIATGALGGYAVACVWGFAARRNRQVEHVP